MGGAQGPFWALLQAMDEYCLSLKLVSETGSPKFPILESLITIPWTQVVAIEEDRPVFAAFQNGGPDWSQVARRVAVLHILYADNWLHPNSLLREDALIYQTELHNS